MTATHNDLVEAVAARLRPCLAVESAADEIAADVLALIAERLRIHNESALGAAGDEVCRQYKDSDWEEAKDVAEGIDVGAIVEAWLAASPLYQQKAPIP